MFKNLLCSVAIYYPVEFFMRCFLYSIKFVIHAFGSLASVIEKIHGCDRVWSKVLSANIVHRFLLFVSRRVASQDRFESALKLREVTSNIALPNWSLLENLVLELLSKIHVLLFWFGIQKTRYMYVTIASEADSNPTERRRRETHLK